MTKIMTAEMEDDAVAADLLGPLHMKDESPLHHRIPNYTPTDNR